MAIGLRSNKIVLIFPYVKELKSKFQSIGQISGEIEKKAMALTFIYTYTLVYTFIHGSRFVSSTRETVFSMTQNRSTLPKDFDSRKVISRHCSRYLIGAT